MRRHVPVVCRFPFAVFDFGLAAEQERALRRAPQMLRMLAPIGLPLLLVEVSHQKFERCSTLVRVEGLVRLCDLLWMVLMLWSVVKPRLARRPRLNLEVVLPQLALTLRVPPLPWLPTLLWLPSGSLDDGLSVPSSDSPRSHQHHPQEIGSSLRWWQVPQSQCPCRCHSQLQRPRRRRLDSSSWWEVQPFWKEEDDNHSLICLGLLVRHPTQEYLSTCW
mmetsp:Transcript_5061/g.14016  ORF Transcript_5061/g.14016 Transcript_5061/m.14016 type:complete len:219 (+) Transcript_5061:662-1318(+)